MLLDFPKENPNIRFQHKTKSDLYELLKSKTYPVGFNTSHIGKFMAIMGKDRILRMFYFPTGKVVWRIDETL